MTRFLVYTTPAVGHTLPLVPGLLELQRRGHEVHVRAMPSLVDTLCGLGLAARPVDPAVLEVPITDHLAATDAERLASGQVDLMARGRHNGPDLERAVAEVQPDALLVDAIAYGALTAAERLGLPWGMVLPSVLTLPEPGIPPYGLGLKPLPGPIGRVRDAVLLRVVLRAFGRAMLPGLNELRGTAGLPALASPLGLYDAPDAVIALSGAPLEYPRRALPRHVHLVGAQQWDLPAERPAYLDEPGDPWVLVTCSSDYQGDEDLARVAVEALRDEPMRVLVTLADAFDTAGLPEATNVRVERFAPHGHVIPECAAVISHGGFGVVSKTVGAGVPAVVVPFGRDQPEVARRVVEAGAGVSLPAKRLTPERLRAAVARARMMGAGAQRAAEVMRRTGGAHAFADAALTLAQVGSVPADVEEADPAHGFSVA